MRGTGGRLLLLLGLGGGLGLLLYPILPLAPGPPSLEERLPRHVEILDGEIRADGVALPLLRCVGFQPLPAGVHPDDYSWLAHPARYLHDLDLLAGAGANTLMVYTRGAAPRDLQQFLDRAWERNLSVILAVDGPNRRDAAQEAERQAFFQRVEAAGAQRRHPALLLWILGNEVDYQYYAQNVGDWYNLFNEGANWLRHVDGHHPIVYAANPGTAAEAVTAAAQADVHGVNFYGLTDGMMRRYLWSLANRTGRPVMLTEYGVDAWDSNASAEALEVQAATLAAAWRGVAQARALGAPVLGGCVHEWSDQWWKNGQPDSHDPTPGWRPPKLGVIPDDFFSDEWFGLAAAGPGETERAPRPALAALAEAWRAPVTMGFPRVCELGPWRHRSRGG